MRHTVSSKDLQLTDVILSSGSEDVLNSAHTYFKFEANVSLNVLII